MYRPPNKQGKQRTTQQVHGLLSEWGFGNERRNLVDIARIAKVESLDVTTDCDTWVIPNEFDYR